MDTFRFFSESVLDFAYFITGNVYEESGFSLKYAFNHDNHEESELSLDELAIELNKPEYGGIGEEVEYRIRAISTNENGPFRYPRSLTKLVIMGRKVPQVYGLRLSDKVHNSDTLGEKKKQEMIEEILKVTSLYNRG